MDLRPKLTSEMGGHTYLDFSLFDQSPYSMQQRHQIDGGIRHIGNALVRCLMLASAMFIVFGHASEASDDDAKQCREFVDKLADDDYRTLFAANYIGPFEASYCFAAHAKDPSDRVFLFGLGVAFSLARRNRQQRLTRAWEYIRKSAELGYEPANIQMLRMMWRESPRHDVIFENRLKFGLTVPKADALKYIDHLASTKSGRAQDLVLGYIILHRIEARLALAKQLVARRMAQGSNRARYLLGYMKLGGFGIERDMWSGFDHIKGAAEGGDVEAQYQFGFLTHAHSNMDGNATFYLIDPIVGLKLLARAANSEFRLGVLAVDTTIGWLAVPKSLSVEETSTKSRQYRARALTVLSCALSEKLKGRLINRRHLPRCSDAN